MTGEGSRARSAVGPARALAVALLVLLGVSMAATLRPREIARRWIFLAKSLGGESLASTEDTRFWFDPAYSKFLEDVKQRTPPGATVAVLVPRSPDTYTYLAVYLLAPRRVVDRPLADRADFVATYGNEHGPPGDPIAGGTLWRR
jgi:hypothetical protein